MGDRTKKTTPFERYQSYIKKLTIDQQPLPVNNFGDINFTVIGKACNVRRQWFSESLDKKMPNGKRLKDQINFDIKMLGTETTKPKTHRPPLSDKADDLRKENNRLYKQVELATAEVEQLRNENAKLKSQLKMTQEESANQFDEMMESGRSFLWN